MKIYLAKIIEVDHSRALIKAQYLDTKTGFVPLLQRANANFRSYSPPTVGEQVLLIELEGGFKCAVASFLNDEFAPLSKESDIRIYKDGGCIEYDFNSSILNITAPDKVIINSPKCYLSGDLIVAGNITDARGDLTGHSHATTDGATAVPR